MNDDISFLVDGTKESIDNVTMLTTEGNDQGINLQLFNEMKNSH